MNPNGVLQKCIFGKDTCIEIKSFYINSLYKFRSGSTGEILFRQQNQKPNNSQTQNYYIRFIRQVCHLD